ncbi:MAG TPA: HAD-IIB family hydrolase [Candidatus Paceibacterota bacterium]|nr:HAD-IIB family hydrolase [Candidatus Paceibacterota bacterium]
MKKNLKNKKLVIFDIDGTLTPSKAPADREMISLLLRLLGEKMIAVIGGGKYDLFKNQLVRRLPKRDERLERLFLFPTNSTAFYRYMPDGSWRKVYSHELSRAEKKKIKAAFAAAFKKINYKHPVKTWGPVIEDRGTQITFSALGQEVVQKLGKRGLELKEEWHKKSDVRPQFMRALRKLLPKFEVRQGGLTSVDVTRKGIDKGYGVRQIEKKLRVKRKEMLFVGDAIFPGGNDYAAVKTGVDYVKVNDPEDTKKVIRSIVGSR